MEERRRSDRRLCASGGGSMGVSRAALYDSETGLASTTLFRDRTAQALSRAARADRKVALLFLEIADAADLGNPRPSRQAAARVAGRVRVHDTVAWLDDGYVGVLVEDVDGPAGAQVIRRRLAGAIEDCVASSVAISDSRGRIGYWLGDTRSGG